MQKSADLINQLSDISVKIINKDYSQVSLYNKLLQTLINMKLDRAELFLLQNKLTNVKALMPFLEDPIRNREILNILNYLRNYCNP